MAAIMKTTILAIVTLMFYSANTEAKLKLLSVVFRHGDRAPDNNGLEMYPNDPYVNNPFDPMRLGGLTNQGKLREFHLGAFLRQQYRTFLGQTYYPSVVATRSTNVDRTKMSLQLVLAALYPPKRNQIWNRFLNWQPIPANYVPGLDDNLMVPEECPKYLKAREQVEASPEFKVKLEAFRNFMNNLTEITGKNISNSNDMYFLYHTLMAEKSMNLPLPKWTANIFPYGKLLDGINLEYEIFSYNKEMRRLNGGMFLRKFIDDMVAYRNRSLDQERKLFLYSGHETNVAAVLQALGVYTPRVPEYSSAVIVELHQDTFGEYYVQVKYYKGIPKLIENKYEEMPVPGCDKYCTLDKFKIALSDVIPSDEDTKCDKRSLRSALENNDIKIASGIIKQILDSIYTEEKHLRHLHK